MRKRSLNHNYRSIHYSFNLPSRSDSDSRHFPTFKTWVLTDWRRFNERGGCKSSLNAPGHCSEKFSKTVRETITVEGHSYGSLKLTTIVTMTKLYQNRILRNECNVPKSKSDILATIHQCVSTDKSPRHMKCPTGSDD